MLNHQPPFLNRRTSRQAVLFVVLALLSMSVPAVMAEAPPQKSGRETGGTTGSAAGTPPGLPARSVNFPDPRVTARQLFAELKQASAGDKDKVLIRLVDLLANLWADSREYVLTSFAKEMTYQSVAPDLERLIDGWLKKDPHEHWLQSGTKWRRAHDAIDLLASYGPKAKESLPLFIRLLNEHSFRCQAARILGRMGPEATPAIPSLVQLLKAEDRDARDARAAAATGLAGIGPQAAAYIPQLKESACTIPDGGNPYEIIEAIKKLGGSVNQHEIYQQASWHNQQADEKKKQAQEKLKLERSMLFELLVTKAISGARWQDTYAKEMKTHNISTEDVHAEVHRRKVRQLME
jgi:hypothetical protein